VKDPIGYKDYRVSLNESRRLIGDNPDDFLNRIGQSFEFIRTEYGLKYEENGFSVEIDIDEVDHRFDVLEDPEKSDSKVSTLDELYSVESGVNARELFVLRKIRVCVDDKVLFNYNSIESNVDVIVPSDVASKEVSLFMGESPYRSGKRLIILGQPINSLLSLKIFLHEWGHNVLCDVEGQEEYPNMKVERGASSYEMSIFRHIAKKLGWSKKESTQFLYYCLSTYSNFEGLLFFDPDVFQKNLLDMQKETESFCTEVIDNLNKEPYNKDDYDFTAFWWMYYEMVVLRDLLQFGYVTEENAMESMHSAMSDLQLIKYGKFREQVVSKGFNPVFNYNLLQQVLGEIKDNIIRPKKSDSIDNLAKTGPVL
jgi:hypothetical protein